ncbi:MAG: hypothetical protein AAFV33_26660 [Chloroflexota bacterium]
MASYLMRMNVRPDEAAVPPAELSRLQHMFDIYSAEVRIHGEPVGWEEITEVELVKAPTVGGLGGIVMGFFVNTQDRYHVGIYLRRDEAVLANISMKQVLYVMQSIAYYAPNPVSYTGPDGIVPLTEL